MSSAGFTLIGPITSGDVSAAWIEMVRVIIARDGYYTLRAGAAHSIEVFSTRTHARPVWHVLMLPGDGCVFTNAAERDLVLNKILEVRP